MKLKGSLKVMIDIFSFAILLFSTLYLPLSENICKAKTENILTVDDDKKECPYADYTSIQEAINGASTGDTIFVYNGTYFENIIVNKSITLIGENKNKTIIDGGGKDSVVYILADEVKISGFTIKNSGNDVLDAGIKLFSNHSIISDNNIIDNFFGIILINSSNNTIRSNRITKSKWDGIHLFESSNDNIIGDNNICSNNKHGILLWYCNNNAIYNNTIYSNNGFGVGLTGCFNIKIHRNNVSSNKGYGLYLCVSENNNISENIVSLGEDGGIYLSLSNNNSIVDNEINFNNYSGLYIGGNSNCNVIIGNNFRNNYEGICIDNSNHNIIIGNNFSSNHIGVCLGYFGYSYDNLFYHNNFIDNVQNAIDKRNTDTWYNSTLKEGNYWDDYNGTDSNGDGIGDVPYNIPGGDNQDRFPLMKPYERVPSDIEDNNSIDDSNRNTNIPGFELIFVIYAIAFVLFLRQGMRR